MEPEPEKAREKEPGPELAAWEPEESAGKAAQ